MRLGLRIDVDTLRGTRLGVPVLCELLADHHAGATFFFSVGPDNMGRHLVRLLKPQFLIKMLRTRAANLYGMDVLIRGTLGPGPRIARKAPEAIRAATEAGFEVGLHAWDHHGWQTRVDRMDRAQVREILQKGIDALSTVTGTVPGCHACPAWRCTDEVLLAKVELPFEYGSDCRGHRIFQPELNGERLAQPQIPTTLPTYDEALGRDGVTDANYNDYIFSRLDPEGLNVLTIHAEAEGIACKELFAQFLARARKEGIEVVALRDLLAGADPAPGRMVRGTMEGREGWISLLEE